MPIIDLTNKTFGRLHVLKYLDVNQYKKAIWECQCSCGNKVYVTGVSLINKHTRSCGCLQKESVSKRKLKNLTGEKIHKLQVIELAYMKNNKAYWKCKCDCGNTVIILGSSLIRNLTKTCGNCGRIGNNIHGYSRTRLYKVWICMKQRCYNNNYDKYYNYGGRGIRICNTWINDPHAFIEWALTNFDINEDCLDSNDVRLSIERKNVNGHYEPHNCTWIPLLDQTKNRRDTRRINGATLREYAQEHKLKLSVVQSRVRTGKLKLDQRL